ncbi:hypothetical protein BDBG_00305 [Blastomyces gilchristii SLH14081]|uniref:Uncharacterized protein n=1 Tax=Blastomyces gilchristii (strain SLH14081) TaxID=559298 RepID=A0A179U6F8_BLAGS|nr:uncharacterized protein BDBG_00305 [Blastomyces gilchristii SLH14081]OAT03606.1 hypothetical protein BDBG_00305 [Blastomyces gilchristii SLH14081]
MPPPATNLASLPPEIAYLIHLALRFHQPIFPNPIHPLLPCYLQHRRQRPLHPALHSAAKMRCAGNAQGQFREREIEEMLIPVGMALAWSITSATTTASTSASTSASNATATAATTAASAATVQMNPLLFWKISGKDPPRSDGRICLLSLWEFPLRDEQVTVPAWPLMYPVAASLVKLEAMLPGARSGGSDNDNVHANNGDNNNDNNDDEYVRLLVRKDILKTLQPTIRHS